MLAYMRSNNCTPGFRDRAQLRPGGGRHAGFALSQSLGARRGCPAPDAERLSRQRRHERDLGSDREWHGR